MEEFNPIDLEGLKLWLDARYGHTVYIDEETTTLASGEGDNIAVWKDLSGNGHDAISTTGTPTPGNLLGLMSCPLFTLTGLQR